MITVGRRASQSSGALRLPQALQGAARAGTGPSEVECAASARRVVRRFQPVMTTGTSPVQCNRSEVPAVGLLGNVTIQRRGVMSVLSRKLVDRPPELPPPQPRNEGFGALNVLPELTQLLVAQGVKQPTSVQKLALPHLLAARDAIIAAQTGTGKTLAYVLPLAQHLIADERAGIPVRPARPRALIIVPSRELAAQVVAVAKQLCHHPSAKFRATMTTGGTSKHKQAQELAGTMSRSAKQDRQRVRPESEHAVK